MFTQRRNFCFYKKIDRLNNQDEVSTQPQNGKTYDQEIGFSHADKSLYISQIEALKKSVSGTKKAEEALWKKGEELEKYLQALWGKLEKIYQKYQNHLFLDWGHGDFLLVENIKLDNIDAIWYGESGDSAYQNEVQEIFFPSIQSLLDRSYFDQAGYGNDEYIFGSTLFEQFLLDWNIDTIDTLFYKKIQETKEKHKLQKSISIKNKEIHSFLKWLNGVDFWYANLQLFLAERYPNWQFRMRKEGVKESYFSIPRYAIQDWKVQVSHSENLKYVEWKDRKKEIENLLNKYMNK